MSVSNARLASALADRYRGGAPRLLVRFSDPARPSYRGVWAYGGGRAYFTIEDRQSDIFVLDVTRR